MTFGTQKVIPRGGDRVPHRPVDATQDRGRQGRATTAGRLRCGRPPGCAQHEVRR